MAAVVPGICGAGGDIGLYRDAGGLVFYAPVATELYLQGGDILVDLFGDWGWSAGHHLANGECAGDKGGGDESG